MTQFSQTAYVRAGQVARMDRGVVPHPDFEDVFIVQGTTKRYRVQVLSPEQALCNCPNGKTRGGSASCYHVLAVWIYLDQRTPAEE